MRATFTLAHAMQNNFEGQGLFEGLFVMVFTVSRAVIEHRLRNPKNVRMKAGQYHKQGRLGSET